MTEHSDGIDWCDECAGHEVEKQMAEKIQEHGWCATGVGPGDGKPPFVYTTGLTKLSHPELTMIALPIHTAYGIITDVIDSLHEGLVLEPGKKYSGLIGGDYELAVVEVINPLGPDYPQSMTKVFYGENFRSFQLVWPDRHGKFPWDEGTLLTEEPVLGIWEPA